MEITQQAEKTAKKKDKGFTLIELLVVVAILATLATVVVVAVRGIQEDSDQSACKTDYVALETALETYAAQNTAAELTTFDALATDGASTGNVKRMEALVTAGLLRRGSELYEIAAFGDIDPVTGGTCVGIYDQSGTGLGEIVG